MRALEGLSIFGITLGMVLALAIAVRAQAPPAHVPPAAKRLRIEARHDPKKSSPERRSNDEARKQIEEKLRAASELKEVSLTVRVDDSSVTLSGEIQTIRQRDVAMEIAKTYAEGRTVIDDFRIIGVR